MKIANLGPLQPSQTSSDTKTTIGWGYIIDTDVLVLEFDEILLDAVAIDSVLSALVQGIQRWFALSDSDFAVLPLVSRSDAGIRQRFAIADTGGRGLIPFATLREEIDDLLRATLDEIRSCSCENGCIRCMRPSHTRFLNSVLSKERTISLLDSLIHDQPFLPSLPQIPTIESNHEGQLNPVRVMLKGEKVEWTSGGRAGTVAKTSDEGDALLAAIQAATEHIVPGSRVLLETNRNYLHNRICGSTVKADKLDAEWQWLGLLYDWVTSASENVCTVSPRSLRE